MIGNLKLVPGDDGSYELLIQYDRFDAEFAMDFFSKGGAAKSRGSIAAFIARNAKNLKISAVKFVIAGIVIASIPFASFMSASAAGVGDKYSMAYLYGGTAAQQIAYVERTNHAIQMVSPSYFDINPDGSLKLNPVNADLVGTMRANGIRVVPFLSNHWDRNAGINALKDVEKLSAQIAGYISQYDLDGVNVDIENVTEQQKAQYTELVRLLRQKIPSHKEVSVAVAANPNGWTLGWHGSYDYTALAQNSDYLMMMTYDEHYQNGPPGPVASIGFVENSIKYGLSKTTPDKLVLGLPFFGRIWSADGGDVAGAGIGIGTVNSMIKDYKAYVTFDKVSQSPKAEFEVKAGDKQYTVAGKSLAPGKYVIWFENDQSLQAKLDLVRKYDLKGAGSWALGQEDVSIWNNYSTWLNGAAAMPSEHILYTVKMGDTLYKLSQSYGVTVDNIKSANNLTGDVIRPGQQLKIPVVGTQTPAPTPPPETTIYTVIAGDTLWKISQTFGATVDQIKTLNNLSSDLINIGQQLKIPVGTAIAPEAPPPSVTETPPIKETPEVTPPAAVTKTTKIAVTIRETASGTGKITGNIDRGVQVTVIGSSGRYLLISHNGVTGYVLMDNLI